MSLAEIIEELPRLTSEERRELAVHLSDLEEGPTEEQWKIIRQRMAEHASAPETAVRWEEVIRPLREKYGV